MSTNDSNPTKPLKTSKKSRKAKGVAAIDLVTSPVAVAPIAEVAPIVEVAPAAERPSMSVDVAVVQVSTPDRIRHRAYELYVTNGGKAFDNWLRAERELARQA